MPSAVYGENVWDVNPIRLKANKVCLISFDSIFDKVDAERAGLVEEVRYLLFCLCVFSMPHLKIAADRHRAGTGWPLEIYPHSFITLKSPLPKNSKNTEIKHFFPNHHD